MLKIFRFQTDPVYDYPLVLPFRDYSFELKRIGLRNRSQELVSSETLRSQCLALTLEEEVRSLLCRTVSHLGSLTGLEVKLWPRLKVEQLVALFHRKASKMILVK